MSGYERDGYQPKSAPKSPKNFPNVTSSVEKPKKELKVKIEVSGLDAVKERVYSLGFMVNEFINAIEGGTKDDSAYTQRIGFAMISFAKEVLYGGRAMKRMNCDTWCSRCGGKSDDFICGKCMNEFNDINNFKENIKKVKPLETSINNCKGCPLMEASIDMNATIYSCSYPDELSSYGNMIENISKMPNWCPLRDADILLSARES